jgi:hypothetical protein
MPSPAWCNQLGILLTAVQYARVFLDAFGAPSTLASPDAVVAPVILYVNDLAVCSLARCSQLVGVSNVLFARWLGTVLGDARFAPARRGPYAVMAEVDQTTATVARVVAMVLDVCTDAATTAVRREAHVAMWHALCTAVAVLVFHSLHSDTVVTASDSVDSFLCHIVEKAWEHLSVSVLCTSSDGSTPLIAHLLDPEALTAMCEAEMPAATLQRVVDSMPATNTGNPPPNLAELRADVQTLAMNLGVHHAVLQLADRLLLLPRDSGEDVGAIVGDMHAAYRCVARCVAQTQASTSTVDTTRIVDRIVQMAVISTAIVANQRACRAPPTAAHLDGVRRVFADRVADVNAAETAQNWLLLGLMVDVAVLVTALEAATDMPAVDVRRRLHVCLADVSVYTMPRVVSDCRRGISRPTTEALRHVRHWSLAADCASAVTHMLALLPDAPMRTCSAHLQHRQELPALQSPSRPFRQIVGPA